MNAWVTGQQFFGHAQNDATLILGATEQRNGNILEIHQDDDARHGKPGTLALLASRQHAADAVMFFGPTHLLLDAHLIRHPCLSKDTRRHQLDDKPNDRQLKVGGRLGQRCNVGADLADDFEAFQCTLDATRLWVGQHLGDGHEASVTLIVCMQGARPRLGIVNQRLM